MYTKLAVAKKTTATSRADLNPAFHREKFISEFFRFDQCIQQVHKRYDADNKKSDHHIG